MDDLDEFGAWTTHVRDDIMAAIRGSVRATASTAEWWSGADRVQIARLARAERAGAAPPETDLEDGVAEVAAFLAASPALTTEALVAGWVNRLGDAAYVEVAGVVARTVAVDTFHRVLGLRPPAIADGERRPPARRAVDTVRKRAWVGMIGFEVPPNTLSAAPTEMAVANGLEAAFYMTGDQMADPDLVRGALHRTQIEVVATALSYTNECFY